MGWSAGRHVDYPCGVQISPWPARKVTEPSTGPEGAFAKPRVNHDRGGLPRRQAVEDRLRAHGADGEARCSPYFAGEFQVTARNHFSLNFCHVVRMWFGRGSDVARRWVGGGSDVLSDLVPSHCRQSGRN